MSLDVALYGEYREEKCMCPHCDHSHTRNIREKLYESNITHNLNTMAEAAGIYYALWRPEAVGYKKARQLIDPLTIGLNLLKSDPERFKIFNAKNGWGAYKDLVLFVEKYLSACEQHPDADVVASR